MEHSKAPAKDNQFKTTRESTPMVARALMVVTVLVHVMSKRAAPHVTAAAFHTAQKMPSQPGDHPPHRHGICTATPRTGMSTTFGTCPGSEEEVLSGPHTDLEVDAQSRKKRQGHLKLIRDDENASALAVVEHDIQHFPQELGKPRGKFI